MRSEPRWISADELIAINQVIVADTGEPHLLRDRTLLESAANAPANHWSYGGVDALAQLASTLLFAIARNHPFAQGNKRTGYAAMDALLRANGCELRAPDTEALAQAVVDVIVGDLDEQSFSKLIEPHVVVHDD